MCISVRHHLEVRVEKQEGKENKAMSLTERQDSNPGRLPGGGGARAASQGDTEK